MGFLNQGSFGLQGLEDQGSDNVVLESKKPGPQVVEAAWVPCAVSEEREGR